MYYATLCANVQERRQYGRPRPDRPVFSGFFRCPGISFHIMISCGLAEEIVGYIRRILRWSALFAAVLLLLQSFGLLQDAWAMLTAMVAMVAIGFVAVWSVLSNTLCSLILLTARPFRVGDQIELPSDNLKGKVVNFSMLFTTLRAEDGAQIQISNNLFFQRVIV